MAAPNGSNKKKATTIGRQQQKAHLAAQCNKSIRAKTEAKAQFATIADPCFVKSFCEDAIRESSH